MKVPLSWLSEFIQIDADHEQVAARLTAAGMKVEKVSRPGADLRGVVVAEVMAIKPHPDADKLTLVDVRTDAGQQQVVCGAKNFQVGDRVPLARVGAKLPEFDSFQAKKIRGVVSDGMLCSGRDMGLDDDHSGIMLLDEDAPLGADVGAVLGLGDTIFELEITPNRPDAMSLIGIAREVAACFGGDLVIPAPELTEGSTQAPSQIAVTIEDPERCPRYFARVITGVNVGASPALVRRRLIAAGVRPISNVVDATNYALMITGQPLHAFDLSKVGGDQIVVRRAKAKETITTLDDATRQLDPDDLVIADATTAMALAGVMGGKESEVSDATTDVLLESAYFAPKGIFRTSKRHSLRSEASARFERGTDPELVAYAADLAAGFIAAWSSGTVSGGVVDVYPVPVAERKIALRPSRTRQVLGMAVEDREVVGSLERLGLEPRWEGDEVVVTVPTRRPDLSIEEDLIEEVARVVGYDRLPSTLPSGSGRSGSIGTEQRQVRALRRLMSGAGLLEARTNSLVGPDLVAKVPFPTSDPRATPVPLANALTREQSLLRTSLVPGLIESAVRNLSRGRGEVRLFEVGSCFHGSGDKLPDEPLLLGAVLAGAVPASWYSPERRFDFFDMKGVFEAVASGTKASLEFIAVTQTPMHPTRAASVQLDGRVIGYVGELAPDVMEAFDVDTHIVVGEIDLRQLFSGSKDTSVTSVQTRFPAVLLDLAVVVDEEVPSGEVIALAKNSGGPLLVGVRLFDVYRGDQVKQGSKSLAVALTFRSPERTLTEAEAIAGRDQIVAALKAGLGAEIRD